MNVTLTLNEITVEQAEKILDLVKTKKIEPSDVPVNTEEAVKAFEKTKPTENNNTDAESKYAIEDVRKAFGELAKKKGKDFAKEMLKKFGASKVTELNSDTFEDVMKAIEEVV